MTTTYSDNPFMPGMVDSVYVPDQLIAGDFKLVTGAAQFGAGLQLKRGTVLAKQTDGTYNTATGTGPSANAILADDVDSTGGAVAGGVYLAGQFNARALILDPSLALAAASDALRAFSIFIKPSVSAADPA